MTKPIIMPSELKKARNVTPQAKLIYIEITWLSQKEGFCWASNTYLADEYGCKPKDISRYINELVKAGYINTEFQKGPKNSVQRKITISQIFRTLPKTKDVPKNLGGGIPNISEGVSQKFRRGYPKNMGIDSKDYSKEDSKKEYLSMPSEEGKSEIPASSPSSTATDDTNTTPESPTPAPTPQEPEKEPDWNEEHFKKFLNLYPKFRCGNISIGKIRKLFFAVEDIEHEYPYIMGYVDGMTADMQSRYLPRIDKFFTEKPYLDHQRYELIAKRHYKTVDEEHEQWKIDHMTPEESEKYTNEFLKELDKFFS